MASGKLTLLQTVQRTLEALGSDAISSISDSVEAQQIAALAEDAYYELLNQKDWPFLNKLTQLDSLGDADFPNYLRIPDDVVRITQIRYDWTDLVTDPTTSIDIKELTWLPPQDFLRKVQGRNSLLTTVDTILSKQGITLLIINDSPAQTWTSFDDEFVVFDAYDSDFESTLQGNNSQVLAKILPAFQIADSFTPEATANFFQLWLAEVKATAFVYLRQEVSPKDEQRARRGLAVLRRDASRTNQSDGKVKFGRPATGSRGSTGDPNLFRSRTS